MKRTNATTTGSIWNFAFLSICGINTLMNLSKQVSNSILSKYVDSLGAAPTVVGMVSSVFALAALIFKLFSGPALDSFSKKKIIVVAMLFMGISFAGYTFSETVPVVVVFRFVQGAAQAFTSTCLLTMASETLPSDKFSTGVGVFALFEALAQAIGPTIGVALMNAVGYHMTFATASAIMVASAITVLFIKQPGQQKRETFHISLDRIFAKEAALFSLLLFIFNLTACVISTYLLIFAEEQSINGNIGLYFTAYACTLLVSRPLIGGLTDRYGVVKVLVPSLGCVVLAYWLISFSVNLWMLLAAGIILAFGQGACQPAVQALCMKCVPAERRGSASSTCYIAQDLGNLVGPVFAGLMIEQFGYTNMWRIMASFAVIAAVFLVAARRKIGRVEAAFAGKTASGG